MSEPESAQGGESGAAGSVPPGNASVTVASHDDGAAGKRRIARILEAEVISDKAAGRAATVGVCAIALGASVAALVGVTAPMPDPHSTLLCADIFEAANVDSRILTAAAAVTAMLAGVANLWAAALANGVHDSLRRRAAIASYLFAAVCTVTTIRARSAGEVASAAVLAITTELPEIERQVACGQIYSSWVGTRARLIPDLSGESEGETEQELDAQSVGVKILEAQNPNPPLFIGCKPVANPEET